MKVISIGNDPKFFQKESSASKRQIEYGRLFDELHIFSRRGGKENVQLSHNVWVRPLRFSEIKKLLQKDQVVISTQDPFEHGFIGVCLKLRYGTPLHVQLHTDFNNTYFLFSSLLNFIRFFLAHIVLPYADEVRVVSKRVKESIKDFNVHTDVLPIRVEPMEVALENVIRKPNSILTVCRLEKEKDIETALHAFSEATREYPDAHFTIAGEGSEKTKLQNLVKELNLENKVTFLGWVKDLPQLYASHSIYISTSLFEGYGMSIVEAAQAGCALVLSDAGIAGELSAFVSKPKDVSLFAENLEKLLGSTELQKEMGEKANASVQKLLVTKEKYLAEYKENVEKAEKNYKKRNFFARVIHFVSALFEGNKILRFIVAGGFVAITQIMFLYALTDFLGIWYLLSSAISFVYGCSASFYLQKFWAFRDKNMEGAGKQFVGFVVVALIGIVINTLSMYFWVDIVGIWYVLAQFITGFIIAVINFLIYKFFIFKNR